MHCAFHIDPVDQRALPIARQLHAVQMSAYAQEAQLLGATHFPPLERTMDDVRTSAEEFLAAFIGEKMVGAVSVSPDQEGMGVNIASLVVAPPFQRRGIGKRLLDMVLAERGGGELTVQTGAKNLPALALYAQAGFVELRRWVVGREPLELVKLHRPGGGASADPLPRLAGIAVLRRLEVSDLAVFQKYRRDPLITRYQDWYGTRTDAEASAFLAKMNARPLLQPGICSQIGIAEPDQLALVGDIGLTLDTEGKSAEIGYTIRRESQGRGMGTAAVREVINLVFEWTDAERVLGIVDPLNVSSIRLLERVGMRMVESRSGIFRDAPCIDHVYAISRK